MITVNPVRVNWSHAMKLSRAVVSLINDVVGLVQDVDVIRQLVGCQHAAAARTAAATLLWMVTLQTAMRRVRVLKSASHNVLLYFSNKYHAANSTRVLRHALCSLNTINRI